MTTAVKTSPSPQPCPRCQSIRGQRSHRRSAWERLLHSFGAEIRRCRQCRFRHASFGSMAVPLGDPEASLKRWTSAAAVFSGLVICIVLVLWLIRHLTASSG